MRRTLTTALATVLATAVMVVGATPAHASSSKTTDADDVSTPLDIASAKLKTQGKRIVATITMHDAFTDDQFVAPSTIGVDFRIDKRTVRGVSVRIVAGVMTAQVCTFKEGGNVYGSQCSTVEASRVSDRAVQFSVKKAKVSKAKILYWRAGSLDAAGACSYPTDCFDTAPNGVTKFKKWRV